MLNPNNLIPKPSVGRSEYGRVKVALPPGKGLMDWVRLTAGKSLSKKRSGIDNEEMSKHSSQDDCWVILFGQVYDVTKYLDFHPGGIPELMRAAGRDGTPLFNQYHAWVNYENMLKACLVGPFTGELNKLPPCGPSTIDESPVSSPNLNTFSVPRNLSEENLVKLELNEQILYISSTYWNEITTKNIIINFSELQSHLRVLVRPFEKPSIEIVIPVYNNSLYTSFYTVSVVSDRIIVLFDYEKNDLNLVLNIKGKIVKKRPTVQYHRGLIRSVKNLSHDTLLYDIALPKNVYFDMPLGHHVSVKIRKGNATLYRPYTPVCSVLPQETLLGSLQFLIKIYSDGICTPTLGKLKEGDVFELSDAIGDIDVDALIGTEKSLVLLAAGTGITPMIPIIRHRLSQAIRPPTKLLFYNKTEKDIPDECVMPVKYKNDVIEISHILSSPSSEWTGLSGRIESSHLPIIDNQTQFLLCGPDGFINSALRILEEIDCKKCNIHVFQG
ncbi:unnamed protein product [Auanema sp. JU1783]|nr:unnamed protein product [Auanema sp. JU1783]